jgi:hypothetical protein
MPVTTYRKSDHRKGHGEGTMKDQCGLSMQRISKEKRMGEEK